MKLIGRFLLISLLIIFSCRQIDAQNIRYNTNHGLVLGFGIGGSYQQSDIANSLGSGLDLSLGSNIFQKEGAFIALDWKFRFLAGQNQAWDHRINDNDTYSNIRYRFFNSDLELGLTLNRLRERTGLILSGFLGAGLTYGLTSSDLLDADNLDYDYTLIDPAAGRSKIVDDLKSLSDGSFETKLLNKGALLPTAGIYLGYQFSPHFSVGIGHKINFSLSENNSLTGLDIDNKPLDESSMDMNHYTSIGFRWHFKAKGSGTGNVSRYVPVATSTMPERISPIPSASAKPEIDITIPYRNPFVTNNRKVDVSARFIRIDKREDISVELDGKETEFEFIASGGKIEVAVDMIKDTSLLAITGKNDKGVARDEIMLIYREQSNDNKPLISTFPAAVTIPSRVNQVSGAAGTTRVNRATRVNENILTNRSERTQNKITTQESPSSRAPEISFINPPSPITTDKNIFLIKAKASNVKAWQDIQVMVNGSQNSFYNFTADGIITLNIGLQEGINEIVISGRNSAGTAKERTSINYKISISEPQPSQTEDIIPSGNVAPVTEAEPAVEVTPVTESIPAGNVAPVTEAEPAVEATPVTESIPAGNVAPVTEAEPVVEATPVTEVLPITNIAPVNEIKPLGVRINPGNSDWQFCLVTPSGTYNRSDLRNSNFKYSGSASSLYFKPIGGGGDAIVNGEAYRLSPGKDYLFTGSITVTVSTSNPGSMGHWSVCIESDKKPISGSGKNRPASPCEQTNGKKK